MVEDEFNRSEPAISFALILRERLSVLMANFIGREALESADRACRTWGMRVASGVAQPGRTITIDGTSAGRVCSSGYSPYQGCGVCIVRMDDAAYGPGTSVAVENTGGALLNAELCSLPMYHADRLVPRGKLIDIPTMPIAAE